MQNINPNESMQQNKSMQQNYFKIILQTTLISFGYGKNNFIA